MNWKLNIYDLKVLVHIWNMKSLEDCSLEYRARRYVEKLLVHYPTLVQDQLPVLNRGSLVSFHSLNEQELRQAIAVQKPGSKLSWTLHHSPAPSGQQGMFWPLPEPNKVYRLLWLCQLKVWSALQAPVVSCVWKRARSERSAWWIASLQLRNSSVP